MAVARQCSCWKVAARTLGVFAAAAFALYVAGGIDPAMLAAR